MRVLVLSGGGSKGAWQAGAISALIERGRQYDAVVGTSVGAINGFGLSLGGANAVVQLWQKIRSTKDVQKRNWQWPWNYSGLYSFSPLEKFLRKESSGKPMSLPVYAASLNLSTGAMQYPNLLWVSDPVGAILDSSSVAMIHRLRPSLCVDGGHKEVAPVRFAVEQLKATELDVILCDPAIEARDDSWKPTGWLLAAVGLRALGSMMDEIIRTDVQGVSRADVYQPTRELPFDALDYSHKNLEKMLSMGYFDVKAVLDAES